LAFSSYKWVKDNDDFLRMHVHDFFFFFSFLNTNMLLFFFSASPHQKHSLASTYILTRISVVHHAALNCTRRIFAILCTSLLFHISISFRSGVGIVISFVSFMVFTYAKTLKK
jgi:Na+/melibiose symporter-like transporter